MEQLKQKVQELILSFRTIELASEDEEIIENCVFACNLLEVVIGFMED